MDKLKIKLNTILTIVFLVSSCGIWWLFKLALPEHYFQWYPVLPGFYYITGLIFVNVITRNLNANPRKLVNLYMIIKLCKTALSVLLVGVYYLVEKVQMRDFIFTFIGFYLLYLGTETYFYYLTEKAIKNKRTNE